MSDFEKLDTYFRSDSLKQKLNHEDVAKLKREKIMRLIKLLLPAVAAALIGLLAILPGLQNRELDLQLSINTPKSSDLEKLHMENTVFYITDKNNKVSNFTAETIDETEPGSQLVKLIKPEGMMPGDDKNLIYVNSPTGYYDQTKKILSLTDNVTMTYSGGLTARTREMFYNAAEGKAYGVEPITADGKLGSLRSEGFEYYGDRDELVFMKKTYITVKQEKDINITADRRVEIYQKEQKLIAVGNAYAENPEMNVRGETLTAYFGKTNDGKEKGQTKIKRFIADKNVVLKNGSDAAGFGSHFDYDLTKDQMVLTGNPAKINNKASTISARKDIIYYPGRNKATARGNVIADDGKNKIYTEKMEVYFQKDKSGATIMERVEIPQKVKIVTADGVVTSDTGIYYPQKKLVKLYDNVVITQKGNVLRGARAETDLNTGVSRLLSGKSRVSGVFLEENIKSGK